jgi:two-component system, OmpR family, phosphate regulon sensor histidine kinase PhoR
MNRFESSAKPSCERERDLRRLNEFHAVLLGVAGHDLRQPIQVIQSTDGWLSRMLDADADKVRQQLGEPAVARLSEQLDRLAGALRLYEDTTAMELSPVPLAPLFDNVRTEGIDPVRQKGRDLRIHPTRAVVMSNAILLDGIVRNLVRNAIQICRRLLS